MNDLFRNRVKHRRLDAIHSLEARNRKRVGRPQLEQESLRINFDRLISTRQGFRERFFNTATEPGFVGHHIRF